jgi:hypothetical protein
MASKGSRQGLPRAARLHVDNGVDVYLTHLAAERGLASHTVNGYARDLAQLTSYLERVGATHLGHVTLPHLQAFVGRLADRGRSPRSRARCVAAVRGLFGFLEQAGWIPANPATLLQVRRVSGRLPQPLGQSDVRRLLAGSRDARAPLCNRTSRLGTCRTPNRSTRFGGGPRARSGQGVAGACRPDRIGGARGDAGVSGTFTSGVVAGTAESVCLRDHMGPAIYEAGVLEVPQGVRPCSRPSVSCRTA